MTSPRTVLVTGAASGIGRATALAFHDQGDRVVAADLDASGLASLPSDVTTEALDVTDRAAVEGLVAETVERTGSLDVVVNCAGTLAFQSTHLVEDADWQRVIEVNLTGTFHVCRAALRVMVEQQAGVILNVASSAAHIGTPWAAAYAASKGGVAAMTKSLAVEYGRQGIRVCAVSPAGVETPMHASFAIPEGADHTLVNRVLPFDGMFGPEAVAGPLVFLASDAADRINGEILHITDAVTA